VSEPKARRGIGSWGQEECSEVNLGFGITGLKGGRCMSVLVFGFYFFIGNFRGRSSRSEATIKQKNFRPKELDREFEK
jgi:hypothetical protein